MYLIIFDPFAPIILQQSVFSCRKQTCHMQGFITAQSMAQPRGETQTSIAQTFQSSLRCVFITTVLVLISK